MHLIRPLVKPYTRTLDGILELMLMIGDFIFALSTYPVRVALGWYKKRYGNCVEASDTESDTQSSFASSKEVNTSEVPTSFIASSGPVPPLEDYNKPSTQRLSAFKEGNASRTPPSRNSSGDASSRQDASGKMTPAEPPAGFERDFFDSVRARQSASGTSQSPTRKSTRGSAHRQDSGNSISKSSRSRKEQRGSSSHHQMWHPPASSYVDDDLDVQHKEDTAVNSVEHATVLARENQQFEEWRQYPAFPSAYPPTPLVATSRLATTSNLVSPTLYPPINEDQGEQVNNTQQDFVRSLLPLREPLDPNHARDLSDKHTTFGIVLSSSPSEMEDADDSMSTSDDDEYEEEDDFDMTLRTPLQPLGSLRSQTRPQLLLPLNTTLSAGSSASVPSRSSALTTAADDKSAAAIGASSDSSLSPSRPNTSTPSVLGKKRALPRTKTQVVRTRVRQIEGIDSIETSSREASESDLLDDSGHILETTLKPEDHQQSSSSGIHVISKETNLGSSNSSISVVDEREQIPPEEKRRKIVRSIPTRIVKTSHNTRPRIPHHASPPGKAPIRKATVTAHRTSATTKQSQSLARPSSSIGILRTREGTTSSKTVGDSAGVLTSDNAKEDGSIRKPIKQTATMKKT